MGGIIQAGKLDRSVTLQQQGTVYNAYGDPEDGFIDLATVWASKRPAPGQERLSNAEMAATSPTVFWVRWSPEIAGLNSKDRLTCESRTYAIVSVVEIGRREGLEIAAIAAGD